MNITAGPAILAHHKSISSSKDRKVMDRDLCQIDVQDVTGDRRDALPRFIPQIFPLIRLLGVLARGEVTVNSSAFCATAIARTGVPEVTVEHRHCAGRSDQIVLLWVRCLRIFQNLAWPGPTVCFGYQACAAGFICEIIQQPDGTAYMKAPIVVAPPIGV